MSNHHKFKRHGYEDAPYEAEHQGGSSAPAGCGSEQGAPGGESSGMGQGYGNPGHGGNPGYGNPGYGPGYANPGQGNPGYANPGQGNPGYGNPGYGNPGYGNAGYGNAGYGNPSQGNPGYSNPGYSNPGNANSSYGYAGYGGSVDNSHFWQGMSSYLPPRYLDQFMIGLALGAGAAWVLSDEELRGKMIKAGMKLYANVAGGFEELKEQMADIRAEVAAERHGDE